MVSKLEVYIGLSLKSGWFLGGSRWSDMKLVGQERDNTFSTSFGTAPLEAFDLPQK